MLDIIIPFYNSLTLESTLASIASQTDTNLSIYLIDDCSSMEYQDLISFYQNFLTIHYYKLEKNGGPGVARQYGIDHSHSSYIMFLDSDDSLGGVDVVENVKKILRNRYDFIIGNFVEETTDGIVFHERDVTWLHGKIYKRSFIKKNKVRFNDTRKNEDNFFNQLMFFHKPKIYYCNEVLYIYRNNMDSMTRRNHYEYYYEGCIYYAYNIGEAMRCALEDHCDLKLISFTGYRCLIAIYFYMIELKDRDLSQLIQYAKRIYSYIDFSLLDSSMKEEALKNYLAIILRDHYSLLLDHGSFDDYMAMLGDKNG